MEDLQILRQQVLRPNSTSVELADFQHSVGKAVAAILWYRTLVIFAIASEQS